MRQFRALWLGIPISPLLPALPCRTIAGGARLSIHLKPRAQADAILGMSEHGGALWLEASVRALPDKGEANDALVRLIARAFGVPRSSVRLASGAKSRYKALDIDGDPGALERRIRALIQAHEGGT